MQTRIAVDVHDNGKSITMAVGDTLEVSLPENDAGARWQTKVDSELLSPIASMDDTHTTWILDDVDQEYQRVFSAAHEGFTVLEMSYNSIEDGRAKSTFSLEVRVGNAAYPKATRRQVPTSQLVVILAEFLFVAIMGALLSFLAVTLALAQSTELTPKLILGVLGTVGMGAIAGSLGVRIISILAGRVR
jgi:hypothetical protein